MRAVAIAFIALLAAGCSSAAPLPITGTDICFHCRQAINDPSMAGQVITDTNQALKFSSTGCMVSWIKENPETAKTAKAIYVTDYTTGRIIKATSATFVPFVKVERYNKTHDYIAFHAPENAVTAAAEHKSTPIKWQQVLEKAE